MDEFEAFAKIVMKIASIPHEVAMIIAEMVLGRGRRRLTLRRPPPTSIGIGGRSFYRLAGIAGVMNEVNVNRDIDEDGFPIVNNATEYFNEYIAPEPIEMITQEISRLHRTLMAPISFVERVMVEQWYRINRLNEEL